MHNSQIIKDYSEYSGIDIETIINNCKNFELLNKKSFESYDKKSDFYEKSDFYIYDLFNQNFDPELLYAKVNRFIPFLGELRFRNDPGTTFLEFGGGLGSFCEIAKSINPVLDVTYCDIDTEISKFTLWRYKKHNIDIKTKIIPQSDFDIDKYDIIFSDAVIEHLDPIKQEKTIKKLSDSIKPGGLLVLLIDLSGKTPEFPMHYDVDIKKLHSIIDNNGFICKYGKNTFASKWIRIKEYLE